MDHQNAIVPCADPPPVRVTITTIEIPSEVASSAANTAELRRALAPLIANRALAVEPPRRPQPVRDTLRYLSPWRPFATLAENYRITRRALRRQGAVSVLAICLTAGLASVLWRAYALPFGLVGGLLVSAILVIRTGAYREYLAAIKEMPGVLSLSAVLRYNAEELLARIRLLWRR